MHLFLILALFFPAVGFSMTGEELLADCSKADSTYERGSCSGYLTGTLATYDLFKGPGEYYCPPDNVTTEQLQPIVVKFLGENLEHLHLPASSMVLNALMLAYPPSERNGGFVKYCPE